MGFDSANLVLPLAASYNERAIKGFTATVTNGLDQRKINCVYEQVHNALTGKSTLYASRRPGVAIAASSYGATGQIAYLVNNRAGGFGSGETVPWVFSVSGNDVRVSNSAGTTTVIVTAANYVPSMVDKTAISGTDTIVLQLFNTSTAAQTVWYSNAIATWTQITDSDFTGLTLTGKMEFMDGYAFAADTVTKAVYNSDLNSIANWNPVNFIMKQIVQDTMRGLIRFGKLVLSFGDETVEGFINNGNPSGSPLISDSSKFYRIGLSQMASGGKYYANLGPRVYFMGKEGGIMNAGIFAYNGSTYEKVSTLPIDKIISENLPYSINTVSFSGKEAISIALDPVTATTQRWLMFFPALNEWFEWQSTVFGPVNNGLYFLGVGSNQHRLYSISTAADNWQDNGTNYTRTHQFALPKQDDSLARMAWCGVIGDTARSAAAMTVEFSDNDGQSFYTQSTLDMTQTKKKTFRCGAYNDRWVRLSDSGNFENRIESFIARVN